MAEIPENWTLGESQRDTGSLKSTRPINAPL